MPKPQYTVIKTITLHSCFCSKLTCFCEWYAEDPDEDTKCPHCGKSDDVMFRKKKPGTANGNRTGHCKEEK